MLKTKSRKRFASRTLFVSLVLLLLSAAFVPALVPSRGTAGAARGDVLVNVTEGDLNRILQDYFHASGGPLFDGSKRRLSKSVADLRYHADLSDPVLRLGDDGEAILSSSIREARIQIGRLEHRIGKHEAYCEDAGLTVDPAQPVDVQLALRFSIQDEDVRIVPESVSLANAREGFHLVKPARCRNTPLPTWLLWWLGKPYLERELGTLDKILLARADRSAEALREEPTLKRHWQVASPFDSHARIDFELAPRHLDTDAGSLFVSLARPDLAGDAGSPGFDALRERCTRSSFLGVSQSFVNDLIASAFAKVSVLPHRPKGNLRKLFESSSIYTLIPGLRNARSMDNVYFTFAVRSAPQVAFVGTGERQSPVDPSLERRPEGALRERPMIRVTLSGIEMKVLETRPGAADELLGTLSIDSGTVGVVPFVNRIGGISFETLENDWVLSSSGIEFDKDLFAATLQEMTFGEIFETRYNPLAREPLSVGKTEFRPSGFDRVGDYLVVDLAGN